MNKKHGMYKTPTYFSWVGMKQRCNNPNKDNYYRYGGRGIIYDPSWEDFETFYADMGERPLGTTINRIDNDGNYCKENCEWANLSTQAINRDNTNVGGTCSIFVKDLSLQEIAQKHSLNYLTVKSRYFKYKKLSEDDLYINLSQPLLKQDNARQVIFISPKQSVFLTKNVRQFCLDNNLSYKVINAILNNKKKSYKNWVAFYDE